MAWMLAPEQYPYPVATVAGGQKLYALRIQIPGSVFRIIVPQGQTVGLFDRELDPRISSFAIFGVLTSYVRWYHPGGPITPNMIGRECAAFVLGSLFSEKEAAMSRFALIDEVSGTWRKPAFYRLRRRKPLAEYLCHSDRG